MACCVPSCMSRPIAVQNGPKDEQEQIVFHHFPINEAIRMKWIKNINRENWTPAFGDQVCSKHFLKTDYKPGIRVKRILNPDAVPTVFQPYSQSLQESAKKYVAKKKPKGIEPPKSNSMLVKSKTDELYYGINVDEYKKLVESIQQGKKEEHAPAVQIKVENSSEQSSDRGQVAQSNAVNKTPNAALSYAARITQFNDDQLRRLTHKEIERQKKYRACQQKLSRTKAEAIKLRLQMLQYQQKYDILRKVHADLNIDAIVADAEKKNVKAMFLKDIMFHYGKRRKKWCKTVLKHARGWRNKYPDCYNYCKTNFLNLPCRNSLNRAMKAEQQSACIVENNDEQPEFHYVLDDISVKMESEDYVE